MDDQQLSWLVIEPGWAVVASDGTEVGYVEEIVGDSDEDIFNGLSISTSIFDEPRYVPSEKVGRIFDDRVELTLATNDVEALAEFLEPRRLASTSTRRRRAGATVSSRKSPTLRRSPMRSRCGSASGPGLRASGAGAR